jgi:hypothetical protein
MRNGDVVMNFKTPIQGGQSNGQGNVNGNGQGNVNGNVTHKCLVKDIPAHDLNRIKRAGIIPFTQYKKDTWFGMGIDRQSGDISDFGGRREIKDRDAIETAIREFTEESLGVYGKFAYDSVKECMALYKGVYMIIFLPIVVNPKLSVKNYKCIVYKGSEMSSLIWMNKKDFLDTVTNAKSSMYSKVRNVLFGAVEDLLI